MNFNEIEFLKFEKSTAILLNSVINYLLVEFKNDKYTAKINFSLSNSLVYKELCINIEEVTAVNINQTIESAGQQIHNYKFFLYKDSYYLSLDPDESSLDLTEDDQDFFVFKKLAAVLI